MLRNTQPRGEDDDSRVGPVLAHFKTPPPTT